MVVISGESVVQHGKVSFCSWFFPRFLLARATHAALGHLEHAGGDGDLDDYTDAAGVEAVQDALRDEEGRDFVGNIFIVGVFGTFFAIGGESEDSSDDEAGKLGAATKAVTDGTAADQRGPEGADHEAEGEDGKQ